MSELNSNSFDQRFQQVVTKMRTTRVLTVLGWTALALMATFVLLAAADYFLETNWNLRAGIVGIACCSAFCAAAYLVVRALQRWNQRSTAAQVEQRFEDLGQSVRTTVQFQNTDAAKNGVSPSLLSALNQDVNSRTEELRLTEAVSMGPLKISVALLSLLMAITLITCCLSWDWRMAAARSLLSDRPYTTVKVSDGDTRVDEKATFTLSAEIGGRTNRPVTLLTRDVQREDDGWESRPLTKEDVADSATRFVSYVVDIPKVKKPFEYQVVAGKYTSPVHTVDVRYPLAIQGFDIELISPAYTGITPKKIDAGSFDAVEGSSVRMGIQLDHSPVKAWLELRPIAVSLGEEPEIETVPLDIDGTNLSTELELMEDRSYEVFAEASDGTKIRPNRFRIRVHEDRAPKLGFQTPAQLTEVHPLAELVMRLRVADDYGLRRAGIVFQRNNEDEITLEDVTFDDVETKDGRLTPQTRARIESMFPLEYFELTVKDSITYYAYAEDNRPGQPNVNETDLQFIDVRPFRRNYPVPEDGQGLSGMGNNNNPNARNLPGLNEMIGRERFILNRTMQMKRHDDRGRRIDVNAIDNLMEVQNETSELAGLMGDEATSIEQRFGIPEEGRISDLLYQSQDSMLAAVDSLSTTEFDVAKLQEKDALQYLIDARQRIDEGSAQNRGGGGAAFRAAFRRMRSRRRSQNDRERAQEVVQRLRQAAAEQEFLMAKMSDLVRPEAPETESDTTPEQDEETPSDDASQEEMPEEDRLESDETSSEQLNEEELNEETLDPEMSDEEMDRQDALNELRRELEQEQADLAEEIEDIIDMMEELQQTTNLVQQRAMRATSNIGGIIGSLGRGNASQAMSGARNTSAALRVLAENVAGVTADEATDRLEVARNLGLRVTHGMRDLNSEIDMVQRTMDQDDLPPETVLEREKGFAAPLADTAESQAEIAKTIEDVLNSILDPERGIQDPEDRMVKRLKEIMDENRLTESVSRAGQVSDIINKTEWTNAAIQTEDLADRFDIVSQRLDAMHREVLSPRIEQLRKLEKRAVEVKQSLASLQTDEQVGRWHLKTDGLLEDIESANVAEAQVQQMRETMEGQGSSGQGGQGTDGENGSGASWEVNESGTALEPPTGYANSLGGVIGEIQRHIRELSLVDSEVTNGGAVPVKYRQFVERYMDVLSGAVDSEQAMGDDATN